MRKFAIKGKNDWKVRKLVEQICSEIEPGDYASEVLGLYYWVCARKEGGGFNFRYMRDPYDAELVKAAVQSVATRAGDCDDATTLLAAMLMACGNECVFIVAAYDNPPNPSHVFVCVNTPAGPVPIDPVANRDTGKMLTKITKAVSVPLLEDPPVRQVTTGTLGSSVPSPGKTIFSVYDYAAREFEYFEGVANVPASGWFRAPVGPPVPESLAARLPPGAKLLGRGTVPKGLIATRSPGVGSFQGESGSRPWLVPLVAVGIGYAVGRWVRR